MDLATRRFVRYARFMRRDDINAEQEAAIEFAIFPPTVYLHRLKERMERLGFPANDPLYLRVVAANDAMHALGRHAQGARCDWVSIRPPTISGSDSGRNS